jgi:hypothetical protein
MSVYPKGGAKPDTLYSRVADLPWYTSYLLILVIFVPCRPMPPINPF